MTTSLMKPTSRSLNGAFRPKFAAALLTAASFAAIAQDDAATRAAKDGHVIVLEHQVFQPLSPFTAQLVEALSEALYGGAAS